MNRELLKLSDGYIRVDYTTLYFCMYVEFSVIKRFCFLSVSPTFLGPMVKYDEISKSCKLS